MGDKTGVGVSVAGVGVGVAVPSPDIPVGAVVEGGTAVCGSEVGTGFTGSITPRKYIWALSSSQFTRR